MDDKRQHVAVIRPPEDFDRFENEQAEEGVTLTKGFRGTEDGVVQSVVFDAIKFDESAVVKWCADKGYTPIQIKLATPEQPAGHKFSSTHVALAPPLSDQVLQMGMSVADEDLAEDGREDEPHITVKYGLHTQDSEAVRRVLSSEGPVRVRFGATSLFPANESHPYDVLKIDVDSEDLRRLNAKLESELPHTKTYSQYQPHVTLAYCKPGMGQKYAGRNDIQGQEAVFASVVFSAATGDKTEIGLQSQVTPETTVTAECDKPKVTAAQVTSLAIGRQPSITAADVTAMVIHAREVPRVTAAQVTETILGESDHWKRQKQAGQGGRFGSTGGSELAHPKANALRDKAQAAGAAADQGAGSHADAMRSYEEAAGAAREVKQRSLEEYDQALRRKDAAGAALHQAQYTKATTNEAMYNDKALYHSQKARDDVEKQFEQADRDKANVRKGFKRGFATGALGTVATAISIGLLLKEKQDGGTGELILDDKEKLALATDAIFAAHESTQDIHAAATGRLTHAPDIIAVVGGVSIQAADPTQRTPRFKIAPAYNGGELRVGRYDLPVVVDLAGLSINPQSVQAVLFHDETKLVGHVERVNNTGKTLSLEGVCSGLASVVAEFLESASKQFPWKASIEARPLERPELIPAGQVVAVNGQQFEGPVYVARKAELYGVSFVPRGADDQTIVSIAARAARHQEEGEMTMARIRAEISFEEWTAAIGVTPEDLEANPELAKRMKDKYAEAMKGMSDKDAKAADDVPPEELDKPAEAADETEEEMKKKEEMAAEEEAKKELAARQRFDLDVIRAKVDDARDGLEIICAKYEDDDYLKKSDLAEIKAKAKTDLLGLKQKAIAGRWSGRQFQSEYEKIHAQAELQMLRKSRPAGVKIISGGRSDPQLNNDILSCAVLQTGRYDKRIKRLDENGAEVIIARERVADLYSDQVQEAASKRFRNGIGLQELIVEAAWLNGWDGRSFKQSPTECLQYAFGRTAWGAPIQAASGTSTADMAGILSNVANKFLMEGFMFVEQSWKEMSAIRNVNDFKTATSYRLTRGGGFTLVAAGGDIKQGRLGEESYTNKAETYAELLGIDRRDIINDDLGAITTVPKTLGRDAGLKVNDVFWKTFLAALGTLFTSARLNALSFAIDAVDTRLGIDSLTLAEQKFLDLKDAQGAPIGHSPSILLTPTGLSVTAAKLFKDTDIRVSASSTKTADYTTGNPHAGKFKPVFSRYISNTGYTGCTTTGWGIFADPKDVPVMETCFLYGQESPTIEQTDADFSQLGIRMRGFFDFGCATQDYRGAVWSAGTSS